MQHAAMWSLQYGCDRREKVRRIVIVFFILIFYNPFFLLIFRNNNIYLECPFIGGSNEIQFLTSNQSNLMMRIRVRSIEKSKWKTYTAVFTFKYWFEGMWVHTFYYNKMCVIVFKRFTKYKKKIKSTNTISQ